MVAGLAERFARQVGDLVGADHHRVGKARGHNVGFFQRQALGERAGRFAFERGFVDFGGVHLEGQMEAGEQFAPVARGRGEDHGALHAAIVRERPDPTGSAGCSPGRPAGALDWDG
ncbi:hypothetical protein D3C84_1059820 [compost metagenome]